MTVIDEQGRPEPPLEADEVEMLRGYLDYQRATLQWKTDGLEAEGLRATLHPTTMTLGGLLKHMALVELIWFVRRLHDRDIGAPWNEVDWDADPDWEWDSAADDPPEELRTTWQDAVARSRDALDGALANGGLDQLAKRPWPNGESPSLRWIMCHMIEEYARHNGHADLLREAVDGEVGE